MNLNKILEMEKSVTTTINGLKEQIVKEIIETPLKDVKPIAENIIVIKFSDLQHNIWSPEYYIPSVQADYVRTVLASVTTAHSFVKKMEEMIEKRGVKIGVNFHRFNDKTVSILEKYYSKTNEEQR
jgi:hypothetical protein